MSQFCGKSLVCQLFYIVLRCFVRFSNMILCYFVRFSNMISGCFVRFSNIIPGISVRFPNAAPTAVRLAAAAHACPVNPVQR